MAVGHQFLERFDHRVDRQPGQRVAGVLDADEGGGRLLDRGVTLHRDGVPGVGGIILRGVQGEAPDGVLKPELELEIERHVGRIGDDQEVVGQLVRVHQIEAQAVAPQEIERRLAGQIFELTKSPLSVCRGLRPAVIEQPSKSPPGLRGDAVAPDHPPPGGRQVGGIQIALHPPRYAAQMEAATFQNRAELIDRSRAQKIVAGFAVDTIKMQ